MPDTATRPQVSALGHDILHGLYAHRLLTTSQVHQLYAHDCSRRWPLAVLARLERDGFARRVSVASRRSHRRTPYAWYLTPAGYAAAEGSGVEPRPFRMNDARAAGPLQAHTLVANEIGTLFVRAARAHGDSFGPADWRLETAWKLGPGRADVLVSDSLLHYTAYERQDATYLPRVVEVDRATTPVPTLVGKLVAYTRLAAYRPGWSGYPLFPGLLVVMDGPDPAALDRRADALARDMHLSTAIRTSQDLVVSVTTLDALRAHGPHAPIFWRPGSDHLVDLRGR